MPTSKSLKSCAGVIFDRAGALLRIGIFVGDDRDQAADQRQDHVLADQMRCSARRPDARQRRLSPSIVSGRVVATTMNERRIFRIESLALDRIAQIPEVALDLDLLHFEIGDRGEQLRVPVDQALVLVDQALAVQLDEHLDDGLRQALVHGEALARPVAGRTEALAAG